jgi:hypothetical protein
MACTVRTAASAALLAIAAAPIAAAAQPRTVPVGKHQDEVRRLTAHETLNAGDVAAANALLDQVLPVLRSNEAAMRSPPVTCVRLTARGVSEASRPTVAIELFHMLVIDGECYNMLSTAVTLHVNTDGPLFQAPLHDTGAEDGGASAIYPPLVGQSSPGPVPRYLVRPRNPLSGKDYVVVARAGVSPFLPVPKGFYLEALERRFVRQLEAERAAAVKTERDAREKWETWVRGGRAEAIARNEESARGMAAYLTPEKLEEHRRALAMAVEANERLLRQLLDQAVARLQPPERTGQPTNQECVRDAACALERVRSERARLTPAEQRLPTCGTSGLTAGPANCAADRQPVMRNPAYWDAELPKGVPQLILIGIGQDPPRDPAAASRIAAEYRHTLQIMETLNYSTLARLIR